jgi:tRNA G18 (ribose-2'-O)-methylase SpoU
MSRNYIRINDLEDDNLKIYSNRNENQLFHINEPSPGIFIAESPNVIIRAMDGGYEPISLLVSDKAAGGEGACVIARCNENIPVYVGETELLEQITGYRLTRGVLCAMKRHQYPDVYDICRNADRIAVLEDVMNPTNVGAIFRSAAALQMDAVLLSGACSDPLYRRAARVSMGTVFQVPWTFFTGNGIDWHINGTDILHDMGFRIASMALRDDAVSVADPDLHREKKLAVVLGTESTGLREETINKSDYKVIIPMSHGVDSLNVAAASAVAFWELGKRNHTII